jgi:hypothetical protein
VPFWQKILSSLALSAALGWKRVLAVEACVWDEVVASNTLVREPNAEVMQWLAKSDL